MCTKQLNLAFEAAISKSSAKFVLVALADYANESGEAYPSVETVCRKTALNRKTVLASLKHLSEAHFIVDSGKRKGKTGNIKIWNLTISKGAEIGTVKDDIQPQKQASNSPKNGTVKQSQKRNSTKNGTVPFLDTNSTKNGTVKQSQKRDIEPSVLLTTSEPSGKDRGKPPKFQKPTPQEIRDYASEKNLNLDGFFDYYESIGWVVGKAKHKMKCWKSAASGWSGRQSNFQKPSSGKIQTEDDLKRAVAASRF